MNYYQLRITGITEELKDSVEQILKKSNLDKTTLHKARFWDYYEYDEEIIPKTKGEMSKLQFEFEDVGFDAEYKGGYYYLDDDCGYTDDEYEALGGMCSPGMLFVKPNQY